MSIEASRQIFDQLTSAQDVDLSAAVLSGAVRYAQIRAEWAMASPERRHDRDTSRTRAHDAFIDACNILSRAQGRSGEANHWRAALGNDRQSIGDFACFVHLFLALSAR